MIYLNNYSISILKNVENKLLFVTRILKTWLIRFTVGLIKMF
jgi:hypothetical protein